MDHVLLPAPLDDETKGHRLPRVPNHCFEAYDRGDFLSYPSRVQSRIVETGSSPTLDSFIQTWLFFGLLHDILSLRHDRGDVAGQVSRDENASSEDGVERQFKEADSKSTASQTPFDASKYIVEDRELGSVIQTTALPDDLRNWEQTIAGWSETRKRKYSEHVRACLRLAAEMVRPFRLAARMTEQYPTMPQQPFIVPTIPLSLLTEETEIFRRVQPGLQSANDLLESSMQGQQGKLHPAIRLSIGILIQTLSSAAATVLGDANVWPILPYSDGLNEQQMLVNGWCRSEVNWLKHRFKLITAGTYLEHLRKPKFGLNHEKCTDRACYHVVIRGEYQPTHVCDTRRCDSTGLVYSDIVKCLEENSYPLLKIDRSRSTLTKLSLETVPYRPDVPYVALSHLWVDGLGNRKSLTLPSCHVRQVFDAVESLKGKTMRWGSFEEEKEVTETEDLLVWIDSICIPLENDPDNRRKAFGMIKDVYANARYVLVFDRELRMTDTSLMASHEKLMRLLTSRWIRRLWTFQEAAAAKKLLIKFKDCVVDLSELRADVLSLRQNSLLHHHLATSISIHAIWLKDWFETAPDDGPQLRQLMHALEFRRVFDPSDEPLCIATALELDPGRILEVNCPWNESLFRATAHGADPKRVRKRREAAEQSRKERQAIERMKVLWQMKADSSRGIPREMIFNPFHRLQADGFRWAPRTLQSSYIDDEKWQIQEEDMTSILSPRGLKVDFPVQQLLRQDPLIFNRAQNRQMIYAQHSDGTWLVMTLSVDLESDVEQPNLHEIFDRNPKTLIPMIEDLPDDADWNGDEDGTSDEFAGAFEKSTADASHEVRPKLDNGTRWCVILQRPHHKQCTAVLASIEEDDENDNGMRLRSKALLRYSPVDPHMQTILSTALPLGLKLRAHPLVSLIGSTRNVRSYMEKLAGRFSNGLARRFVNATASCFMVLGKILERLFVRRCGQIAAEAMKRPEVAAAWPRTPSPPSQGIISHITMICFGWTYFLEDIDVPDDGYCVD